MKTKIKHVFFDLDHTLWDFDKNSDLTFKKIFELHGLKIDTDLFLKTYKPINQNYWKLYREEKITKRQLRYGRFKDAFDAIDELVSDALINKLSKDYITFLTTFNHIFEGTYDILEYLEEKYRLHIITNGFEEAQEKKLQASDLRGYFDTVTNSEMVGVKKPNSKIFNFALNSAEANASESIMIGDNIEADILGALNAGMDAILFNYHKYDIVNRFKSVDKLKDLKNFL